MLAAFSIFTYGATTGATQSFYVDERFYARYALELANWLVLRQPVQFSYMHPQGYSLVLAAVYGVYYALGSLTGMFSGLGDFLVHFAVNQSGFIVLGRLVSAAFAVGSLPFLYKLALGLFDRRVAILATAAAAVAYPIVFYAHLAANITMVIFLTSVAGNFIYLVWQRGKTRDYFLAGLVIGTGIGTKYYPGVLLLPLFIAHCLRVGVGWRRPNRVWVDWQRLVWASFAVVAGTLIFFPGLILETEQWRFAMRDTLSYYIGGNPLQNAWRLIAGNPAYWQQSTAEPISWWANSLRVVGEVGLVWLGLGIVYGAIRFPYRWLLLAPPFLILFAHQSLRGGLQLGVRQFYFALPLLYVLASAAVLDVLGRIRVAYNVRRAFAACLTVILLLQPTIWTFRYLTLASNPTTLDQARVWLLANLEPQSVLLADTSYAPFGEAAEWQDWRDKSGLLGQSTARAIAAARKATAPPFRIVALGRDAYNEDVLSWSNYSVPVYVAVADYAYAKWEPETYAAWGGFGVGMTTVAKYRQFYVALETSGQLVKTFYPRESNALGPVIKIYQLPFRDAER